MRGFGYACIATSKYVLLLTEEEETLEVFLRNLYLTLKIKHATFLGYIFIIIPLFKSH